MAQKGYISEFMNGGRIVLTVKLKTCRKGSNCPATFRSLFI